MRDTHQALIDYAISERKVLTVKAYSYLSREREYIDKVLDSYLKDVGLFHLQSQVAYCLHELAGNAHKANTKRVYFKEMGLNINNPSDYVRGMRNFKADTVDAIHSYKIKQRDAALYIRFDFKHQDDFLHIRIRNNTLLTPEEQDRIAHKLEAASHYNSIVEAYSVIEDSSEGAGLGIVMMIQMLKTLGFGEQALQIGTSQDETIAELILNTQIEIDETALIGIA